MIKIKNSLSAKLLSILLVFSILIGMVPSTIINVFAESESFATIETLVDGGTINGNVVVFDDNTTLNWFAKDTSVGRWTDGWWVGIKVIAPADVNLETAAYQNKTSTGWGDAKSFKQYRDSNDQSETQYITLWGIVNEGYLNDAIINGKEYLEYGYQFDWNGDGVYEQPISMRVIPNKIKLNKNGTQEYPKTTGLANVDIITDGITTTNNGGNIIEIENTSNVELTWVAADATIGRNQDGWWVGYNVVAPDGWNTEKASYQHKTSNGWDTANTYSFDKFKDTDNSIQVWRLINETYLNSAVENNKNVNYITRYDWDGDGVYEQIVHLKLNPANVVLKATNGEQVYPYLGTVMPLTTGTVSGNTSNLEFKVESATLNWFKADASVGRNIDGWWVGMKIYAPAGYTLDQIKAVTFDRYVSANGGTSFNETKNIKFWDSRESSSDSSNYSAQMWMYVSPALVRSYQEKGNNIQTKYVFDWDNNGTDDQTIAFTVVPSDKIVFNKVEQTNFAFVDPNPVDKWVGETYTNTASGGQGTGDVTYAITSGTDIADIDAKTGKLTFKKIGVVTVTATKAADDTYKEATATYTVKAVKKDQAEFKFENSNENIVVEFANGSFTNTADGGSGDGKITYSISDDNIATIDSNTGKVTFKKAGEVTIYAKKAEDDNYTETTATYTLTIEKSNQQPLDVTHDDAIIYTSDAQDVFTVADNKCGNGEITYSIIEGSEYATIDNTTGKITTQKAGTIKIQIDKAGDDGYNAATPYVATIVIYKADQKDFAFADKDPDDVTYNDNNNKFSNVVSGGQGTGAITYAFKDAESEDIADIDATTGEITINAAGTITVVATKASDDCYNAITAEYSLTVKKDTPEFTVGNVDLVYGVKEYQINVNTTVASADYIYSIEGTNNIGASIDASGKVTFENSTDKVGTITINVKREADNQYVEAEKSFKITVSYHESVEQPTVNGETKNNSGWYTDSVVIKAPTGYTIAYENKLIGTVWANEVAFDKEGINDAIVYLKSNEGYITDSITIADIKLDTGDPDQNAIAITYDTPTWEKVLETITFGIYKSDSLLVKLTAKDVNSGIASLTYNFGGEDVVVSFDGETSVSHSFIINEQFRNEVVLTAIDIAGRKTQLNSEHIIVLDTKVPEIEAAYDYASSQHREYNDVLYSQGDVDVILTITETNFDLSEAPVVKVNDQETAVNWTKVTDTDKYQAIVPLSGNGDYSVSVAFTDIATNKMVDFEQAIHIDDVAPVFDVTYSNNEARNSNNYKADRVATIKVTEHNFKAEEVVLNVTAKDITGATVDISSKAYAEYAKNAANWTQDGDEWTLVIPKFDIDAIYNITLNYTDLAENAATEYATEFVLDKTVANADNVTIEYSASLWDKVLETVTFGFYQGDVQVKVTVKDQTAGVEYFEITYTQADGENNSNKATYTTEKLAAVQDANDKTVFTVEHTIKAEARGTVSVNLIDKAGNTTGRSEDYVVVADTIAPGLEYKWTFTDDQVREYNNIYYTKGETKVKFIITEANFDLSLKTADDETAAPAPVLTVNNVAQNITWTQIDGTDKWETEITLTGNDDYVVELSYTDRSTNAMETYTKEIHIDDVAPIFDVTYSNNDARNSNNYKADRVATIKVTEHNFKAEEVVLNVTAKDITGATVDISSKAYAEYAKNAANWTQDGDEWTLVIPKFDIDAIYNITLNYTDLVENAATEYATEFVLDKTKSSNIKIEYSASIVDKVLETITFGFYKPDVIITVTAQDDTAGVEYFKITYTKQVGTSAINKDSYTTEELVAIQDATNKNIFTATHTIPANARGTVSVELIDKAGNGNNAVNPLVLVVDKVNPTREVIYTPYKILDAVTMLEVNDYKEGDNSILYYKNSAVVTFKITEANLDLSLKDEATKPVIKVNNVPVSVDWSNDGDVWTATHTINGNGDYVVTMTYTDLSTNEMVSYESCKIAIDSDVPVIDVKYTDGTPNQTIDERKYYKTTQTVNVTINEHNFRADDVVLTVTAKDVQGNPVDISSKKYADYAKNRDNWNHNGDVHTLKTDGMVFDIDAIYTFDIVYDDIIDNFAADYAQDDFVVDHAIPENLKIEYSTSIVDKIIETITFGFYEPKVTVTLTADDITSGVDFFEWSYTQEEGTSSVNKVTMEEMIKLYPEAKDYTNEGKTATVSFDIPANARGYITASVTDRSGNSTSKTDKNNITVVVDDIDPTISVKYEADNAETKVQFTDDNFVTVDTFEKATGAYYNGNVTAKIVINEANFFEGIEAANGVIHNVGIKLTKTDDDGNVTVYEYLPIGAVQKYDGATPKYITWTTSGDEHSFNISYADNADYVLEVEYTDLSTNDASISANDGNKVVKSYVSKVVTVDKIAPIVDIEYSNENVIHSIEGRDYFDAEQTATITVEEHNFRADDFVATVVAKDIVGENVNVENFKATLSDDSKWDSIGNIHTITIKYSVDANYNFDFEYKDLAQNVSAEYDEDLFTVDKTAPENLTVSYSQSIADRILETITFGYYNAKVTVTITADDDTAGIHRFEYAYLKSEGVSSVNAELLNAAIEEADFTVDGKKSTTIFVIPKDVLKSENQFNGTVKFVAFDRSENNTEKADTRRVIVDNIAPTATITYNAPVQNANDISYYAGNIDAKIVINEANFYSEDVVVKVNDQVVAVKWVDDSVDVHTGTFTLTEDGDYIVTVEYTDRSDNEMTKYTSNRLTLDTKAPTVSVTNIKQSSANKDEKYGFTITANDINLDATSFKPVLTATIRKDDGSYGTKTISLGEMNTVEAGKTYTFTVDNLEDDAVYSLVCTLKDMSGNEYSKIALSDGNEYDDVKFSINRNGSTFAVDENTEALVNQYYVYSVDEDVVIVEVNVDPVENYVVKLNGEALTEGTDYSSTLSDRSGEWSKRTYVISKELFKSEGEYSIIVESTDKANTTAYSDVKNLNVSFVVDQTAPVLTISGLENNGRYQVEEQTVTVIPTDDGGRLYSIKVIVLNSDGEPLKDASGKDISVRFEMSGEEFLTYLTENNGKITFTVPEGLENQVQIICNDYAAKADGKTNEYNETYKKVTVSQSGWIIFYANKPLFYGSIAGVLLIAAGVIFLIFLKKRKKEDK